MPVKRGDGGLKVNTNAQQVSVNVDSKGVDTPNTKKALEIRKKTGVNSPRAGDGTMAFPATANGDNTSTTQDGQPVPSFMTQVQRPDTQNTDEEIAKSQRQVTSTNTCCSWLCCYRKGQPEKDSPPAGGPSNSSVEIATKPVSNNVPAAAKITQVSSPPAGSSTPEEPLEESSSEDPEGLLEPRTTKKKCLVLDLDETLVHSSFKPVPDADFIVPVEIDQVVYKVYVLKRPYVDEFLEEVAKHYEVVIFTASLSLYANPLLDMLDKNGIIAHRLFRESCVLHGQAYVKDMSKLGRKLKDVMIVDNSPLSYAFQPTSAIPITSWFDDRNDRQLQQLLPVLKTTLKNCDDVRDILDANNRSFEWLCQQAS